MDAESNPQKRNDHRERQRADDDRKQNAHHHPAYAVAFFPRLRLHCRHVQSPFLNS